MMANSYWPTRVAQKCTQDPSLAVAHRCLWKFHPHIAWKWELRLQEEIGEHFVLQEKDSGTLSTSFFTTNTALAIQILEEEIKYRLKKGLLKEVFPLNRSGLWANNSQKMLDLEHRMQQIQNRSTFIIDASDRDKSIK
jgi:hypothetical protein